MTLTTGTTANMVPISLEALEKAMREIDLLPRLNEWVVVDPSGRIYKGKFEDVFPVMLREHPLFKTGAFALGIPNGDG